MSQVAFGGNFYVCFVVVFVSFDIAVAVVVASPFTDIFSTTCSP